MSEAHKAAELAEPMMFGYVVRFGDGEEAEYLNNENGLTPLLLDARFLDTWEEAMRDALDTIGFPQDEIPPRRGSEAPNFRICYVRIYPEVVVC